MAAELDQTAATAAAEAVAGQSWWLRKPRIRHQSRVDGRTPREAPELGAACRRMMRALVRRAGAGDIEALAELWKLEADALIATGHAARSAHDGAGYSWSEIGRAVGTSAQNAHQRWGSK